MLMTGGCGVLRSRSAPATENRTGQHIIRSPPTHNESGDMSSETASRADTTDANINIGLDMSIMRRGRRGSSGRTESRHTRLRTRRPGQVPARGRPAVRRHCGPRGPRWRVTSWRVRLLPLPDAARPGSAYRPGGGVLLEAAGAQQETRARTNPSPKHDADGERQMQLSLINRK